MVNVLKMLAIKYVKHTYITGSPHQGKIRLIMENSKTNSLQGKIREYEYCLKIDNIPENIRAFMLQD